MKDSEINTTAGRDWLRGLLRKQEVVVTFAKKNGEERKMTSTLNFDIIPKEFHPKTEIKEDHEKQKEETSLAVYDVNAKGWRSFLWANVKTIELSLGEQNG